MNLATERLKTIFAHSAYYFESLTDARGVSFPTILLVCMHIATVFLHFLHWENFS